MVYAVIDTNILVSPQLKLINCKSSWKFVLAAFYSLYNEDIIIEYEDVLHRRKFKLTEDQIRLVIDCVKQNGIDSERFSYDGNMPDEDDRVFYEVALSEEDSFLVTGNLKHFPKTPKVITAAQMMEILDHEF